MQAYMTQPRKRLLTCLSRHADETLSAAEISRELPEISVSAVYRNLSALEQDGAVRRVAKAGSREVFYQYIDAERCREQLHLSCRQCGRTFHMDEAETEALARALEQVDGFSLDKKETVLYGVCGACKNEKMKLGKNE